MLCKKSRSLPPYGHPGHLIGFRGSGKYMVNAASALPRLSPGFRLVNRAPPRRAGRPSNLRCPCAATVQATALSKRRGTTAKSVHSALHQRSPRLKTKANPATTALYWKAPAGCKPQARSQSTGNFTNTAALRSDVALWWSPPSSFTEHDRPDFLPRWARRTSCPHDTTQLIH